MPIHKDFGLFESLFSVGKRKEPKGRLLPKLPQAVDIPAREVGREQIIKSGIVSSTATDKTLHTVPANKKLFITSARLFSQQDGGTGVTSSALFINLVVALLQIRTNTDESLSQTLTFSPPLEVEAGQSITMTHIEGTTPTASTTRAGFTGYEQLVSTI